MDETKKGFMQNIGDLSFKKIDEANFEYSIKILENCLNTGGIAHGGFIATIADTGMGNAAHIAAGNKRCVTINLDIKFISAGKLNERLIGKVKVLKKPDIYAVWMPNKKDFFELPSNFFDGQTKGNNK